MVGEKALRRDAAENRRRLLVAAASVFNEHGLDAGVEEIAREAGVGLGTLYRRFATKDALISELVRTLLGDILRVAESAVSAPNGEGLERVLSGAGAVQSANRGCLPRLWSDRESASLRSDLRQHLIELLHLAKQNDRIRSDATLEDVDLVFWAVRSAVETSQGVTDSAWQRTLTIMLAGLRPGAERLDTRPMTGEEYEGIAARMNPATG